MVFSSLVPGNRAGNPQFSFLLVSSSLLTFTRSEFLPPREVLIWNCYFCSLCCSKRSQSFLTDVCLLHPLFPFTSFPSLSVYVSHLPKIPSPEIDPLFLLLFIKKRSHGYSLAGSQDILPFPFSSFPHLYFELSQALNCSPPRNMFHLTYFFCPFYSSDRSNGVVLTFSE